MIFLYLLYYEYISAQRAKNNKDSNMMSLNQSAYLSKMNWRQS